ncbi:MAG: PQQ-binding-like beta-propeller repeat protein [Planctomycetota bacterium]
MPSRLSNAVVAVVTLVFASTTIQAQSPNQDIWSQWRGPHRDGQVVGAAWPTDLSQQHLSEKWTVPLGPSYSGPIVSQDRVFVTETKDNKFEVVRALDRETGKQIWETQWEGSMKVPFFASANGSWIRATPAFDGERLYVAGMKDVLVCLDAGTGEIVWKRDFIADTGSPLPQFGFASSPLVYGDHIYVQAGASFAKLEKLTGKIVWQSLKDEGGMYGSAFSSPVFATIAGVPQFVVQTRTNLAGVSPEDGTVLWSQEITAFRGMNILTPTVIGDAIFTSSYGGRSTLWKVSREDASWKVTEAWSHKSQGYMSSPVVIDGHICLHLRNQRLVCLDATTGEERWTTKPFGQYWSMVANGDKLLALDESGELLLIQSSADEFRLIDQTTVGDNAWAHVAIVNDEIFVRDLREMKAFVWQ